MRRLDINPITFYTPEKTLPETDIRIILDYANRLDVWISLKVILAFVCTLSSTLNPRFKLRLLKHDRKTQAEIAVDILKQDF